jgi:hypothetical protein
MCTACVKTKVATLSCPHKTFVCNVQSLLKSIKEMQSEKDGGANVAEWDAQELKDQLEDLKSHHTTTLRQLASSSTCFQSFTMKQLIEFVRQLHGLPVDWKRENAD